MLFRVIALLIADSPGGDAEELDDEDFEEEQCLVARLVHHLHADIVDEQYKILVAARKHFGTGGPRRLKYTLPPLVFCALTGCEQRPPPLLALLIHSRAARP